MPPTPRATNPIMRRFWGFVHRYLRLFSLSYCRWFGVPYDNQIAQLPFGLILKWSDGTRLEEVLTMQVARNAGLPVPKVICYGEHPDCPHAAYSILMTRVSGKELGQVYDSLSDEDRTPIFTQLKSFLETMRQWKSPWGENRICSLIGSSIRSVRIPKHSAGPFESEAEFNEYLIKPAWAGSFSSEAAYNDTLNRAQQMEKLSPHRIVFTHGDLKHHNIMVQDGKITGFLDWESAGWYPEYWDFTTAFGITRKTFWWYDFVKRLGGTLYLKELECEHALFSLTSSSYYW